MATKQHDEPAAPDNSEGKARAGGPGVGPAMALRYARRVAATARNAAEVVRFGGLETGEEPSPFTVEAEGPNYRLRRYFSDDVPVDSTPILLIPPLMMATEVWDVSPGSSGVASLHAEGLDTWVVDFGDPGHEPGGLQRTLTDHVLAVSDAVDDVVKATGRDVVLAGYSQGGMFAYQTAAFRRGKDIDSLVTFGAPADTTAPLPIPVSPEVAARLAAGLLDSGVLRKLALPKWATGLGFKM
ncbi:MAG: putative long chain acyl-CoA synthase, partial [Pseudonocardiales bacterium]|nr:putative long chain acyl-CoA synthase [Pseudonocardiales bacterium]